MRARCRLLALIALGVLLPAGVKAQSSVTLKAAVSETVSLSVVPGSINADVVNFGNTVRITWTSTSSPVLHVPLLVRSNTGFRISASFESKTAVLSQLVVADVRATGRLVSPQIVKTLDRKMYLDPDTSQALLVVTGPRVSLGGTLLSPNNALQITVLIRLDHLPQRDSLVHLTFVATPGSLIQ